MFKRHFFRASEIFSVETLEAPTGMPSFCNLQISRNSDAFGANIGGCGLYFLMHKGQAIYLGKFSGSAHDIFGGDIFTARWNRHLATITLRGSRISVSQTNLERAHANRILEPLMGELHNADLSVLAADRGFVVPYKRLLNAAYNWNDFSQPASEWLDDFAVGYLQLDRAAWSQEDVAGIRERVTMAEATAILRMPTILNGRGEFEVGLLSSASKETSKEALFELLESAFDSIGSVDSSVDDHTQKDISRPDLDSSYLGERFLEALPSDGPQHAVEAILEAFSTESRVEIHYTKANGGDLRIRALHPFKRNIFTMYWQSRNAVFFCRLLLSPEHVVGDGIVCSERSPAPEPLTTTFKFDSSSASSIENLVCLIQRALDYLADPIKK